MTPEEMEVWKAEQAERLRLVLEQIPRWVEEAVRGSDDRMLRSLAGLLGTATQQWLILTGQAATKREAAKQKTLSPTDIVKQADELRKLIDDRRSDDELAKRRLAQAQ